MNKAKFSKPPITDEEREKKVTAFINLSDDRIDKKNTNIDAVEQKKEKTKPVYLRAQESLWDDIHEVMAITGLSMNAICIELLRPQIKAKLKDLKNN